ncbi:MAG: hypothetical protein CO135_02235 [Candidatus Levybacteria bacterium CG_4_9_14_3_um_filter_35_16]|nr:MAG: hypothetical protein COW87_00695 [Candidatus Levybacteria bacterium CG22_combo_CG10-13_8_21_14_all_35_11]PIY94849.1 MAG: hypothetical protein COY68_01155 [Candidatus Levybacteria bacterium CG_4_10_14_0_8_um_filter_35_23]PJA91280.1 MAG: hypothetical protein CO135_02235 [Candidatus Levybacteria bacterium CG_4_9_14_3_um_filter_35_16]PJC54277.1 MAG: hypothetical protein CO028_03105 [Candidatus Levybacteria bacterium CG_4_9_14_0_2_um_filter_35_21]
MKKIVKKRTNRIIRRKRIAIFILLLGIFLSFLSLFLSVYYNVLFKDLPKNPVSKTRMSALIDLEILLKKKNIQYQKVLPGNDLSLFITLKDEGLVIFSLKRDLSTQTSSLQLILSRLTIEGKRLKKLDFRFDKPIIELIKY